jgi:hypothetical protein
MRTETEILTDIHTLDAEIDLAKAKRKALSEEFDQAQQQRLANKAESVGKYPSRSE